MRGIGLLCEEAAANGVENFVCSSGGNAGLAASYAANKLGKSIQVFVPETTSQYMQNKLRQEGAEVIAHGRAWDDANEEAKKHANQPGHQLIPPFDHPTIWRGYHPIIEEIFEEGIKPGCIVVSVGGGGLMIGLIEGLRKVGWEDVPIIAVEPNGAASFYAATQMGELVTLDSINTVSVSLGARRVSQRALDLSHEHQIHPVQVSDADSIKACLRFVDDHRVLVEPACGVALSTIYSQHSILESFDNIVVIVCGGSNVSLKLLEEWYETFGAERCI